MKLLFLIFLIYLNYGATQIPDAERYVVRAFPKKVQPGMFQINFSNKYVNQRKLDEIAQHELEEAKKYTAFMPIDKKTIRSVPDSLLFPNDLLPEPKTRVKKVLPDYTWSVVRNKRSADIKKRNGPARLKGIKRNPKARLGVKGLKPKARSGPKSKKSRAGARPQRKGRKGIKKGKKLLKKNKLQRSKKRSVLRKGSKNKNKKLRGKITRNKPKAKRGPVRSAGNGTPEDTRRLIAARDATIEEYPYVVSIQRNHEHWCAGALLNPRLIITTANCMWKGDQISRMKVRVGSRYTNQGGQLFKIQEVMRHPGWMIRNNPDCDVALALLDGNVRFSHSVHAVDLPNHSMLPPFDDAWVTSWGSERRDGVYDALSNSLQVYHVRLMDHDKCNNITERFRVSVTENFICLAQAGKRAPCTRDTGAPAVSDGVVWGLASWGIRKLCGTERYPAMFSYLASPANIEFLANATRHLMADERNYPYLDKWPRRRVTPTTPAPLTFPQ